MRIEHFYGKLRTECIIVIYFENSSAALSLTLTAQKAKIDCTVDALERK